jgi:hypothetical protein
MSKYNSRKVSEIIGGQKVTFDSVVERDRYRYLRLLELAGEISILELQPAYVLFPSYKRNGKVVRAETYRGDFRYMKDGRVILEDVKGQRLPLYLSKLKRLLFINPDLHFIEVSKKQKQWVEVVK